MATFGMTLSEHNLWTAVREIVQGAEYPLDEYGIRRRLRDDPYRKRPSLDALEETLQLLSQNKEVEFVVSGHEGGWARPSTLPKSHAQLMFAAKASLEAAVEKCSDPERLSIAAQMLEASDDEWVNFLMFWKGRVPTHSA